MSTRLDAATFAPIEELIYDDAVAAAHDPATFRPVIFGCTSIVTRRTD